MDSYSPVPVDGLAEAIGFSSLPVPLIVLYRRDPRLPRRVPFRSIGYGSSIIHKLRRQAVEQLAFVHTGDLLKLTILAAALRGLRGVGTSLTDCRCPIIRCFNVERFELASRNRFLSLHRGDRRNVRSLRP